MTAGSGRLLMLDNCVIRRRGAVTWRKPGSEVAPATDAAWGACWEGTRRVIRLVGVPIAILLLAAACGGDDDGSAADGSSAAGGAEQREVPEARGSESGDEGSDAGRAVVTIKEEFAFAVASCSTSRGQVSGNTRLADDEVWINFSIPPEDWETNENFNNAPDMSVSDNRQLPNVQWRAKYDASVPGSLDYTIEGSRVTGSAIFTSVAPASRGLEFESETVKGTFDIDCGG